MTKPRFLFWTLGLIAIFLIAACASASTPTSAPLPPVDSAPAATNVPTEAVPNVTQAPTQVAVVQPAATSRGDQLEATDPGTVRLDSGQLQLIEFFRFT